MIDTQEKKYNSIQEEIDALNVKIKAKLNDFLNKQRLEKIEESYKLARTEIIIDEIIKETKEIIKKIPVYKSRPLSSLANKIDYFEGEREKLIERRGELKEEQDVLDYATKIEDD
jgi:hypothetical protein